jgi:hypothetical protein
MITVNRLALKNPYGMFPVHLHVFGVTWSCVLSSKTSSFGTARRSERIESFATTVSRLFFKKQYSRLCVQMNKVYVLFVPWPLNWQDNSETSGMTYTCTPLATHTDALASVADPSQRRYLLWPFIWDGRRRLVKVRWRNGFLALFLILFSQHIFSELDRFVPLFTFFLTPSAFAESSIVSCSSSRLYGHRPSRVQRVRVGFHCHV